MFTSKTGKLLIVILLTLSNLCAQHVDDALQKYVDLFKFEANRRGIDGEYHIKNISGGIFLVPLPSELLGLYDPIGNKIEINSTYSWNTFLMKWTMFHEIGHSVGLMHIKKAHNTIMQSHQPQTYFFITDSEWQGMLNEYFTKKIED